MKPRAPNAKSQRVSKCRSVPKAPLNIEVTRRRLLLQNVLEASKMLRELASAVPDGLILQGHSAKELLRQQSDHLIELVRLNDREGIFSSI